MSVAAGGLIVSEPVICPFLVDVNVPDALTQNISRFALLNVLEKEQDTRYQPGRRAAHRSQRVWSVGWTRASSVCRAHPFQAHRQRL
jgi:hypothetical protein